jgi:hypothetical protein
MAMCGNGGEEVSLLEYGVHRYGVSTPSELESNSTYLSPRRIFLKGIFIVY